MNQHWNRRRVLQALATGLAGSRFAFAAGNGVGVSPAPERTLELFNTHTSETLHVVYWREGEYIAAALEKLRRVMRDHRNGATHDIAPALYDQLHGLARAARRDARFDIISGYRSPQSNSKLAAASSGVAKKSLHMQGRAIDVRLRGCSCASLRDLALAAQQGGVGYYHRSDFVHLDTGCFRAWSG